MFLEANRDIGGFSRTDRRLPLTESGNAKAMKKRAIHAYVLSRWECILFSGQNSVVVRGEYDILESHNANHSRLGK